MKQTILNVNGIECSGCENRIQNALKNIEGIEEVIASYENGTVIIKALDSINLEIVKEKINDLGFEVKE